MQFSRRTLIAAPLALATTAAHAQSAPIARTRHGRVRGAVASEVLSFKGVRYGASTRRFQAPERPQAWRGVRDALAFGPACPQRGLDGEAQSEDCLFLNVWTPALSGSRPVALYIHGGAYNTGSGSSPVTDGARLAAYGDVVVVTLNHRLNAFGYAYLAGHGFPDSGNAGQLDLILALEWVRDNIANFGGDPACVTVFGQSGGGAKIATLMAMPAAAGLFHRAFTMSGQQVTASGPGNAARRTDAYLAALGLGAETARNIAALSADRLVEALTPTDPVLGFGSLYFGPVLDQRHLTRHPFYPDAAPQSLGIPMMIGNTHDETRGFVGSDRGVFAMTWDEVPARLAGAMRVDILPSYVVSEYRRLYPHYTPSDVYFAASTAARSWRGALIELEERAKAGAPAYAYQLDWRASAEGGIFGAPHTLDIPLVFGTLEASEWIGARTREAEAMSRTLMDAFIRFARTGDPGWAPYTLPARSTMIFDTTSRVENDPRRAERELFARVPYVQPGT
ncbi:carboxylesterase/lipase family protein [Terricaulis silvestris]|uniref:Carboxylic ester hydrolase n=1 Tax=Terricaulis silvestris TaxID=2686094 RepID=A0A6I6MPW0_9CAUL|nr:carboxylesterase/lipase family protein [Terricaulis silvestris]QGZ94894.1 Para-nitrobenzyl esterase [Terricaulis silvestris]